MSKGKIALITLAFVAITLVVPLLLLLALVDANSFSVYIVVFGTMFFGSIGFLFAMLLKTKSDIQEQIEEIKVQNAAIAYKLTEMKKQGNSVQPSVEPKPMVKTEVKEKFDDFN
jgi:hypothetical protein